MYLFGNGYVFVVFAFLFVDLLVQIVEWTFPSPYDQLIFGHLGMNQL